MKEEGEKMGKKTKLAVAIAAASAAAWAGSKAVAKPQKRDQKENLNFERPVVFAHHGGAQIAPFHANFIINVDHATAKNIKDLVTLTQKQVFQKFGYNLEPEIIFL